MLHKDLHKYQKKQQLEDNGIGEEIILHPFTSTARQEASSSKCVLHINKLIDKHWIHWQTFASTHTNSRIGILFRIIFQAKRKKKPKIECKKQIEIGIERKKS